MEMNFFNFPFYVDKAERRAEKKLYGHHAHNLMKTDIKEKKDGHVTVFQFSGDYSNTSLMNTDIKENDNDYELTMNLPGVKKEDVLCARTLRIRNFFLLFVPLPLF